MADEEVAEFFTGFEVVMEVFNGLSDSYHRLN
jgi:hypothetical protein